jgi:hypothetical protein
MKHYKQAPRKSRGGELGMELGLYTPLCALNSGSGKQKRDNKVY